MNARLLLVEDDPEIAGFVGRGLSAEGYSVETAADGVRGLERALAREHDVIVLDVMLPGLDGIELCRALRADGVDTLVLMLTARDGIDERIEGLRSGADDYLPKPFAFGELLARIEALLRRSGAALAEDGEDIELGGLRLDAQAKKLVRDGEAVSLTVTEYALIDYLMRHAGRVCSKKELVEQVWGTPYDPDTNIVEVYISYVRNKLGTGRKTRIETVRGFGYMMVAEP